MQLRGARRGREAGAVMHSRGERAKRERGGTAMRVLGSDRSATMQPLETHAWSAIVCGAKYMCVWG